MTAATPLINGTDFVTLSTKDLEAKARGVLRRSAGPA